MRYSRVPIYRETKKGGLVTLPKSVGGSPTDTLDDRDIKCPGVYPGVRCYLSGSEGLVILLENHYGPSLVN